MNVSQPISVIWKTESYGSILSKLADSVAVSEIGCGVCARPKPTAAPTGAAQYSWSDEGVTPLGLERSERR
jgi:hypothetical protein